MRKKEKKNIIRAILIVIASCLVLLLPFSCQDKPDAIPKNELQIENNEFFVTENSIKMVAENFANGFEVNKSNLLKTQKTYSLNKFLDKETGEELLYVINYEDGGFLIIPADNRVYPILAHSETSSFGIEESKIPGGVNIWVQDIKKVIKKIKQENKKQSDEIKLAWDKYLRSSNLKVIDPDPCEDQIYTYGPLLQTKWHQYNNFNDSIPAINCSTYLPGGKPYVGCVTVAMAQVMKYHQHPSTYIWSSMPNDYATAATARLIKNIGISNHMNYTCDGSSTSTQTYVVPSLENDFGYSTSATYSGYGIYSYQTIQNEIYNARPVIMRGDDVAKGFGYAWVCDGYQESYFCETGNTWLTLHMNWGELYGMYNGYFGYYYHFYFGEYTLSSNVGFVYGIKP